MMLLPRGDRIDILAPAKLNLFLEILGKRADGFHELETVMSPLSICDTLRFSPRDDTRLILTSRWATGWASQYGLDSHSLPPSEQNLVIRALQLLRDHAGIERGADIELIKRIPVQAGMGGASADAAAALLGGNHLWKLGLSRQELVPLAARLGSDIPFFLTSQPAICRGRGERIELLPRLSPLAVVLVRPPEGLSTPAVYRKCRVPECPEKSAGLLEAWSAGDLRGIGRSLTNRLQAPAAELSTWMPRLQEAFARTDCSGYLMTGSGSTWFGICRNIGHARFVAARMRAQQLGWVEVATTGPQLSGTPTS